MNADKPQILLVDDDVHILRAVGDFLTANGYNMLFAGSGHEALRVLQAARPDLILLDIMMPDMDGGDVAQAIRERAPTAKVPIIFLTAAVRDDEVKQHGGKIGGEVYVAKTASPSDLLARIRRTLDEAAAGNAARGPARPV
jgi:DNA-binding response OmpR family regulator